jgi:inhibitor of KinA sporulation pathway (predicted exonuclease)
MARQLDQILVIDVESTCWQGKAPTGQVSEISEIGICPVEVAASQRLEKSSILIKPQRSKISAFCTELTTLTPDMFEHAGTFRDAVHILKQEYHTKDRLWASWG